MWKQPWRYSEGWAICLGIFFTGAVLQFSVGEVCTESFGFPLNLVLGGMFLVCLLLFHLISKKIHALVWFAGPVAGITALTSFFALILFMGFTGLQSLTSSWPFLLLSLYLLWLLGLVVLLRASRFKWKDAGFVLNHAGLFVVFLGMLLGSGDVQRVRMSVPLHEIEWRATDQKNQMVELPLAIQLKSFTIDEYPPKIMIMGQPQNASIEVTPVTLQLLDWELEVSRHLPAAAIVMSQDTLNCVPYYAQGATSALYVKARNVIDNTQKEGWVSCGSYLFPFTPLRLTQEQILMMAKREPKRFASEVTIHTQSGGTTDAIIEVNQPLSIAGWKIYQSSYEAERGKWSRYSVFELVKDPWLAVVYTGIGMLLAGCFLMLFTIHLKRD